MWIFLSLLGEAEPNDISYMKGWECRLSCYFNNTHKHTHTKNYYFTGYLGGEKLITPLHYLSMIPGHTICRMAFSRMLTTKRTHELLVDFVLHLPKKYMNKGSVTLTTCMQKKIEGMDINQFMPSNIIALT